MKYLAFALLALTLSGCLWVAVGAGVGAGAAAGSYAVNHYVLHTDKPAPAK